MRRGIVQLNGADTTKVVHVSGELVVVGGFREDTLGHELVRLIVQVVMEVVSKKKVGYGRLTVLVPSQSGGTVSSE